LVSARKNEQGEERENTAIKLNYSKTRSNIIIVIMTTFPFRGLSKIYIYYSWKHRRLHKVPCLLFEFPFEKESESSPNQRYDLLDDCTCLSLLGNKLAIWSVREEELKSFFPTVVLNIIV
jgi:hypothetical protein